MLVSNLNMIGNNLYNVRKSKGMTQAEVAEKAEISDRSYADIERGVSTMRLDTLLKICSALQITPNDILVSEDSKALTEEDIIHMLSKCKNNSKKTALELLEVYIRSLN